MKKKLKYFLVACFALAVWITADWLWPVKTSIRQFDPHVIADYDTGMWKSYYAKKPVKMFFQLARLLRSQYHAPFWRSYIIAYRAGKAAFIFKKGNNRTDYEKALPELEKYFVQIGRLSKEQFNTKEIAKTELEWWIIHRERKQYTYADLESALQKQMAIMYSGPDSAFTLYAFHRTKAMEICDQKEIEKNITSSDWESIRSHLMQSWTELHKSVAIKSMN